MIVEGPPVRDLVIAVVQTRTCLGEQGAKALLPLAERFRGDGFVIEVQDIEEEKDERVGVQDFYDGLAFNYKLIRELSTPH